MQNQDPEKDIYQEIGPESNHAQEIDYEFITGDQTEGVAYFDNSNTVHECRFEIVSTAYATAAPPIHLEVVMTEQMVQVNDLNTKSIYVDELNQIGLTSNPDFSNDPTSYWLYLKLQKRPLITLNLDSPKVSNKICIYLGTGKQVNQETIMYRKTIPVFEDGISPLFPLNIRNASKYSYMNILDMLPHESAQTHELLDPIESNQTPAILQRNSNILFQMRRRRCRGKHFITDHLGHILDKTTVPVG